MTDQPDGIKGLKGREPVGVVLSIGERDSRGIPINKDRFHLMMPKASEGDGRNLRRVHHPAYRTYNGLQPERRQILYGALVHDTKDHAFEHHLKAQKISGIAPENMRPACVGDGTTAKRWDNETGDYLRIQCPHERCQYRLTDPPSCKPFMRLLFRLVWPAGLAAGEWPSLLCMLTSGSWNTTRNALGMFDELENAAKAMSVNRYSLYGYPFTLTLLQQTSQKKKARFPVVHFSATESPEAFFMAQQKRLADMGGKYASIEDMREPEQVFEDMREISIPGTIEGDNK